jgi:hypothetical protein
MIAISSNALLAKNATDNLRRKHKARIFLSVCGVSVASMTCCCLDVGEECDAREGYSNSK